MMDDGFWSTLKTWLYIENERKFMFLRVLKIFEPEESRIVPGSSLYLLSSAENKQLIAVC
jgi:hypothetical protein